MADFATILNTIRSNASQAYQDRVPVATQTNITDVGSSVMSSQTTQNEFLTALVNKIAMTIVHNKTYRNPLQILKSGKIPLGKNIEEIYTNMVTGTLYNPEGTDLMSRAIPDTKAIYHTLNRQGKYKATVSKSQLLTAFTSYSELEKLLNTIVSAIYSGDNYDEFMLMKELVASGIAGGKIKSTTVTPITDTQTAKDFVKAIKKTSGEMTFPTSVFNSYYDINKATDAKPVITWTPVESQILLLRNDVSVDVDMELLAQAFNVSYAELKTRTIIVDSFGTDVDCGALLCDEALFMVKDQLTQMETFHNGDGLYDNYIYHHWQLYSLSLFANALAFKFA